MVDEPERSDLGHGIWQVEKERVFPGFVELDVRTGSNRIARSFPLDLNLEVDEWSLSIPRPAGLFQRLAAPFSAADGADPREIRLTVRLHHCYVRYRCEGVHIPGNSKYRSATEIGSYTDKRSSSDKTASNTSLGGNLGGAASAGASGISASGDAALRVSNQWQGNRTTERIVAASHDIYEVESVPGGWRVGDKVHGDPLKQGGMLDGPYFSREVKEHPHSCMVEFHPHTTTGKIVFDVTTRDGLRIQREDSCLAAIGERDQATALMKDRLAELCLASAEGHSSEILLSRIKVECGVASDEEGER